MLEIVLAVVTLGIGYFVWLVIAFGRGQSPGKQLLKMRVVNLQAGSTATWGSMFLREFIAKPVVMVLSTITLGVVNFWLLWDAKNQELWDKAVNTVVVDDKG